MTGDNEVRPYGFSYSDLIIRVIPHSVLSAYPNKALSFAIIREAIIVNKPTPPFNGRIRRSNDSGNKKCQFN